MGSLFCSSALECSGVFGSRFHKALDTVVKTRRRVPLAFSKSAPSNQLPRRFFYSKNRADIPPRTPKGIKASRKILERVFSQSPEGSAACFLPALKTTKELSEKTTAADDENHRRHSSIVAAAFDWMAVEAKFRHLHQVAGWVDISDKSVWDAYVKEVMCGKLKDGDRLFEAGCGVGAFLTSCQLLSENLQLGGMDGACKTITLVKRDLCPQQLANNFSSGMIPDALSSVESDSWDVVVCNSVFQYLVDEAQAREAVLEMLRIGRRWVVIADVCDREFHDITQKHRARLEESAGCALPEYRTFRKTWWEQEFEKLGHSVSIRHVEEKRYQRTQERYVVYLEIGAGQPQGSPRPDCLFPPPSAMLRTGLRSRRLARPQVARSSGARC